MGPHWLNDRGSDSAVGGSTVGRGLNLFTGASDSVLITPLSGFAKGLKYLNGEVHLSL